MSGSQRGLWEDQKTAAERKVKISIAIDADLLKTVEAEAKERPQPIKYDSGCAREWVGKVGKILDAITRSESSIEHKIKSPMAVWPEKLGRHRAGH